MCSCDTVTDADDSQNSEGCRDTAGAVQGDEPVDPEDTLRCFSSLVRSSVCSCDTVTDADDSQNSEGCRDTVVGVQL